MARVIISGISSGVGKTTVVNAILSLLEDVQPFKIGPDFIDPKFHKFITGKPSINLDSYIYDNETLKYLYNKYSKGSSISVIEGVMGLYDGLNHSLENNSTAHVSRILDSPVVLVVDGNKQATSLAAQIKGFIELDKRVNLQGVILNRVSSRRYQYLKSAIEMHTNLKCLGYLPNDSELNIKERHLGLLQAEEIKGLEDKVKKLKKIAQETINLEGLIEIANSATEIKSNQFIEQDIINCYQGKTIAIARDEAFSFTYDVHLDLFKLAGMNVIYFSPLNDNTLPDSDIYFFPGGYPELHLDKLSSNLTMINDIRRKSLEGAKILAECGGFIYLSKGIWLKNKFHELVGLVDVEIEHTSKLDIKRFGYIEVKHNDFLVRGHEFHYSKIRTCNEPNQVYRIINKDYYCGYQVNNTIAGYPHLLYYSNLKYFKEVFKRGEK